MHFIFLSALSSCLWAGVVFGISFVAQASKFGTPGLERGMALATGRQMFRAMHRVEAGLAVISIGLATLAHGPWRALPMLAGLILLLQMTALMPALSQRIDARLAGRTPPPSAHHALFAVLETAKLALLLGAALAPLLVP